MTVFETKRKATWKTKLFCLCFNFVPTYRNTGGRVQFISEDYREVHVRLKLGWRTRNYVGTMFGGSLASAADPFYMTQLMHVLGDQYVVWDKAATVRFRRPGTAHLYIRFLITDDLLEQIHQRLAIENEIDVAIETDWVDRTGKVYANVIKTIYIAPKSYYKQKQAARKKVLG